MNDQIKLLVAGATIAIAGVVAGGLVVAWAMASDGGRRMGDRASSGPSAVSFQPSSVAGRSSPVINSKPIQISPNVFPAGGTNVRLGPIRGTNIHLLTSVATNGSKRLLPRSTWQASAPTGAMSFSAFQQVQNVPEVKKAREEAAEAQRRYFEAMKKAAEGRK